MSSIFPNGCVPVYWVHWYCWGASDVLWAIVCQQAEKEKRKKIYFTSGPYPLPSNRYFPVVLWANDGQCTSSSIYHIKENAHILYAMIKKGDSTIRTGVALQQSLQAVNITDSNRKIQQRRESATIYYVRKKFIRVSCNLQASELTGPGSWIFNFICCQYNHCSSYQHHMLPHINATPLLCTFR